MLMYPLTANIPIDFQSPWRPYSSSSQNKLKNLQDHILLLQLKLDSWKRVLEMSQVSFYEQLQNS